MPPILRGRPLLQVVPSFKTVHRTVLKFTPCRAYPKHFVFGLKANFLCRHYAVGNFSFALQKKNRKFLSHRLLKHLPHKNFNRPISKVYALRRKRRRKEMPPTLRESALLQALSLLPNSPPDCLVIHPFQSASVWGISPSADGDKGRCPLTLQAFFRKRLERKPF